MSHWSPRNTLVVGAVALSTAAVAFAVLLHWIRMTPPDYVQMRLAAERDAFRDVRRETGPEIEIGALFEAGDGTPGTASGAWPGFRGPQADNIASTGVGLASSWAPNGPPVLWSVELGEGYAGPAIRDGRVYVLDYDETREADMLRCLSLDDGVEIWRRGYEVRVKRNHGMSRTVPAVDERCVVTIGPKCHVMCVAADTGDLLWGIDLVREWGTKVPLWYAGQCPLLDGETAVLAPAGDALLIGVARETGDVVWQTPNPRGWKMSHSSVIPMTLAGRRMYVYCALGGVAGVAADGADRGRLLWETTAWDKSVVAPSPVAVGGNRFLVTAGYGSGSMLFEVQADTNAGYRVAIVHEWDRKDFACEQHTPVYYQGHLFTVMPKDAGELREQLLCMRPDGTHVWSSGKTHRFGLGPFMVVNGRLLAMSDDGRLTMAAASTRAFEPMAAADILQGREAWAPLAVAGNRLLARDFRRLVCLDMAGEDE